MSLNYEIRLQRLEECVSKLSNETQYLQDLFNLCLQDYIETKLREAQTNAQNIEKYEYILKSHQINKERLSDNDGIPENHEQIDLKAELGILNNQQYPILNTNLKRISPENTSCNQLFPDEYNNNSNNYSINNQISVTKNSKKTRKAKCYSKRITKEVCFSTFTDEEKERIFYDKVTLGSSKLERKWGINHKILNYYGEREMQHILISESAEMEWLEEEKSRIDSKMREMVPKDIINRVEEHLNYSSSGYPRIKNKITITELCNLAFERGIALAGARYQINLFELEFLLQNLCKDKYLEMEKNKWFCINIENIVKSRLLGKEEKLEIARLMRLRELCLYLRNLGLINILLVFIGKCC